MRARIWSGLVIGALAGGCADESYPAMAEDDFVAVEVSEAAKAIGIDRFQAFETATALEIEGLAADGTIVGRLELTMGRFVMEVDDGREVDGRRMTVDVLERRAVHESEGYLQLELPMASLPDETRAFLLDSNVTAPLVARGIDLDAASGGPVDQHEADEEAYISCPFGFYDFYHNNGGSSCQNSSGWGGCSPWWGMMSYHGDHWKELRCCSSGTYGSLNERTCTAPMSGSPCGQTGGGGCAVCWSSWYVGQHCYVWPEANGSCTAGWCA